ncbi:pyridoxamine 5'-phosphate oxidase family protein [Aquabacter spiritensis]|uniref:General stress protein 26 n=1 Tax=Aquabacter spiritensis TaxID=933073 RepID=A0A4R3LYY0_9HYPH|nr:pyridoxamine 5'-phosphate oxidase family protein [Aquabacter spiritensis]TCT05920.1 general stress protein 26 [Aquabacter spiritensis]
MDVQDIWHEMAARHACMLIDRDGGRLRARPMAPVAKPADGVVWFVTDVRSAKDDEIERDPQVCIAYAEPNDRFYLSVSGTAEVVRDVAKLKEIWSSAMEAFFPGGPEDPNARLIKVTPDQAEIWKGDNSLVTGVKMATAILQEKRADLGENAKLRM